MFSRDAESDNEPVTRASDPKEEAETSSREGGDGDGTPAVHEAPQQRPDGVLSLCDTQASPSSALLQFPQGNADDARPCCCLASLPTALETGAPAGLSGSPSGAPTSSTLAAVQPILEREQIGEASGQLRGIEACERGLPRDAGRNAHTDCPTVAEAEREKTCVERDEDAVPLESGMHDSVRACSERRWSGLLSDERRRSQESHVSLSCAEVAASHECSGTEEKSGLSGVWGLKDAPCWSRVELGSSVNFPGSGSSSYLPSSLPGPLLPCLPAWTSHCVESCQPLATMDDSTRRARSLDQGLKALLDEAAEDESDGDDLLETTAMKRGNSWPYFWVRRLLLLERRSLLYFSLPVSPGAPPRGCLPLQPRTRILVLRDCVSLYGRRNAYLLAVFNPSESAWHVGSAGASLKTSFLSSLAALLPVASLAPAASLGASPPTTIAASVPASCSPSFASHPRPSQRRRGFREPASRRASPRFRRLSTASGAQIPLCALPISINHILPIKLPSASPDARLPSPATASASDYASSVRNTGAMCSGRSLAERNQPQAPASFLASPVYICSPAAFAREFDAAPHPKFLFDFPDSGTYCRFCRSLAVAVRRIQRRADKSTGLRSASAACGASRLGSFHRHNPSGDEKPACERFSSGQGFAEETHSGVTPPGFVREEDSRCSPVSCSCRGGCAAPRLDSPLALASTSDPVEPGNRGKRNAPLPEACGILTVASPRLPFSAAASPPGTSWAEAASRRRSCCSEELAACFSAPLQNRLSSRNEEPCHGVACQSGFAESVVSEQGLDTHEKLPVCSPRDSLAACESPAPIVFADRPRCFYSSFERHSRRASQDSSVPSLSSPRTFPWEQFEGALDTVSQPEESFSQELGNPESSLGGCAASKDHTSRAQECRDKLGSRRPSSCARGLERTEISAPGPLAAPTASSCGAVCGCECSYPPFPEVRLSRGEFASETRGSCFPAPPGASLCGSDEGAVADCCSSPSCLRRSSGEACRSMQQKRLFHARESGGASGYAAAMENHFMRSFPEEKQRLEEGRCGRNGGGGLSARQMSRPEEDEETPAKWVGEATLVSLHSTVSRLLHVLEELRTNSKSTEDGAVAPAEQSATHRSEDFFTGSSTSATSPRSGGSSKRMWGFPSALADVSARSHLGSCRNSSTANGSEGGPPAGDATSLDTLAAAVRESLRAMSAESGAWAPRGRGANAFLAQNAWLLRAAETCAAEAPGGDEARADASLAAADEKEALLAQQQDQLERLQSVVQFLLRQQELQLVEGRYRDAAALQEDWEEQQRQWEQERRLRRQKCQRPQPGLEAISTRDTTSAAQISPLRASDGIEKEALHRPSHEALRSEGGATRVDEVSGTGARHAWREAAAKTQQGEISPAVWSAETGHSRSLRSLPLPLLAQQQVLDDWESRKQNARQKSAPAVTGMEGKRDSSWVSLRRRITLTEAPMTSPEGVECPRDVDSCSSRQRTEEPLFFCIATPRLTSEASEEGEPAQETSGAGCVGGRQPEDRPRTQEDRACPAVEQAALLSSGSGERDRACDCSTPPGAWSRAARGVGSYLATALQAEDAGSDVERSEAHLYKEWRGGGAPTAVMGEKKAQDKDARRNKIQDAQGDAGRAGSLGDQLGVKLPGGVQVGPPVEYFALPTAGKHNRLNLCVCPSREEARERDATTSDTGSGVSPSSAAGREVEIWRSFSARKQRAEDFVCGPNRGEAFYVHRDLAPHRKAEPRKGGRDSDVLC
ncbi:hypothetical protein BESB_085250 [Besnoitia besnoiti]|uniref:Uncharacterized protein n=1 Tax=Besnoitia besnoiti TaxID=94643 RepID=A0A2A9MBN3_BESBE|nr:hypothetical protein BESB_085250 [Besnoitia besnoiti]PFH33326.1 hypothetical protein BESB_085250 [Besnoitia besnoiti]